MIVMILAVPVDTAGDAGAGAGHTGGGKEENDGVEACRGAGS